MRELEKQLDTPVDYRGTDQNVLRRGISYFAKGMESIKNYFGWRPRVPKYEIRPLEEGVGGMYSPDSQIITLNSEMLRKNPEFGEEAAVHEGVHGIQRDTGSIGAYAIGLRKAYGFLGRLLVVPMVEGIASFYTQRIRGKTQDGYGAYRAGATQMVRDHGERSLIDPVYIAKNLGSMANSFLKGMFNYNRFSFGDYKS